MNAIRMLSKAERAKRFRAHKLIAMLEMASEAEKLKRHRQAKFLYLRALSLTAICFGACSAERAAVLLDLVRISETLGESKEANGYYSQALAIGCLGMFRQVIDAA